MNLTKNINALLDAFALCLADELSEKRLFEKKEIATMLKTRTWSVLHDTLAQSIDDNETLRIALVAEYNNKLTHSGRKKQVAVMLANLNVEMEAAKKSKHAIQRQMDYDALKAWLIAKYGKAVFTEFINTFNK